MRKSLVSVSVVAALCLTLAGCGDTHDSITREMLAQITELNKILDGVKDEASAKAAAPRVERTATKLKEIQDRSTKLGQPSEAEMKAMKAKYEKQMEEQAGKLIGNVMRIGMNPDLSKHLEPAMNKIPDKSPF
jgi:hypothetical protein